MTNCRRRLTAVLIAVTGAGAGAYLSADSVPVQQTERIAAVWSLSAQPCNGEPGTAMERHPKEAEIKASGTISLAPLGVEFTVPQIPFVEKTHLKVFMGDQSRGVIDHYLLLSDRDLEPPFAAVVITELPANLQSPEEAFKAVHILESQLSTQAGVPVNLEPIDSPFGEALEMLVRNRVGTYCFPTSDFQLLPPDAGVSTMGISRFAMIENRLVEFSLIVTVPERAADADAKRIAREIMDTFWQELRTLQEIVDRGP